MRISVVIPTFNRREWLLRALQSVLDQTFRPHEVLVVDDGSHDGTVGVVSARFPAVRLFRQPNRGVSAARNLGIAHATGDWIAFLDSDDSWRPEKLARQRAAIEANPDRCICHTDELWLRNGRRVNPRQRHAKPDGWAFERCLPLCALSPSSVLVRRELFAVVGIFDETLPACEDYDLWLRICARYPVLLVPEPLVIKQGGHADQLSRRYPAMDRFRIRALHKLLGNNLLTARQARAALGTLREKTRIYCAGARKRRRLAEADLLEAEYRRLQRLWEQAA